ncbi:hypothetical protein [Pseudomonas sp. WSY_20]|uniref:hypothetical protein n=1 Tax=Pseudomonas sp. WSY_20 TaxID=3367212 RepID=UPI00370B4916
MTIASPLPTTALNTSALPSWQQWAASEMPADQFEQLREPHLHHTPYLSFFNETLSSIVKVSNGLSSPSDKATLIGLSTSAQQRYRDMPFYPRDLLDFARNLPAPPTTQQQNT